MSQWSFSLIFLRGWHIINLAKLANVNRVVSDVRELASYQWLPGGMDMTQVNMLEAKSDLSKLVRLLESKQEEVIYLARNGTAVVQMTLIPRKPVGRRIGVAEGKFKVPDEFDEWDEEVEDMFGGEL